MAQTYTVKSGDTLNGIAAKYGYTGYKAAGITGYGSNPDLITPGMVLTIGGGAPATSAPAAPAALPANQFKTPSGAIVDASTGALVTPPPVVTDPSINAGINSGQTADHAAASSASAPPTRTGVTDVVALAKELKSVLTPSTPEPATPDFAAQFKDLRNQYGVDALETQATDLKTQADQIQADLQAQRNSERSKPVAMNVIEGRISEEEAAANERLTLVNNQLKTVSDQLTTKYNLINSLMGFSKDTYTVAKDKYDSEFTQNLNMINTVKGLADTAQTNVEQAADDARANLQLIYNNITSGAITNVDPGMQATITKLEVQAGLPSGFYQDLQSKNPKSDIISTTTRTDGTQKYADVLLRNDDGSITTKSIYLGSDSGTPSSGNKTDTAYSLINQLLDRKMSNGIPYTVNGYFTPEGFKAIVSSAAESGVSRADIISQYADKFSPGAIDSYGLTPKERADLGIQ